MFSIVLPTSAKWCFTGVVWSFNLTSRFGPGKWTSNIITLPICNPGTLSWPSCVQGAITVYLRVVRWHSGELSGSPDLSKELVGISIAYGYFFHQLNKNRNIP